MSGAFFTVYILNLCAANIALKLAPFDKATAYLGTNAFCAGLAAALAPIIGRAIGSYFAIRKIHHQHPLSSRAQGHLPPQEWRTTPARQHRSRCQSLRRSHHPPTHGMQPIADFFLHP